MTQTSLSPVVRHIRMLVGADPAGERSDAELLERFVADRDERAFAALLRRHGPLVWSVCWQVLHHRQDAEDAFQATFLLLARQAASIRKTEAVASWLCRVAYRVARRAGQNMARRRGQERQVEERQVSRPEAEAAWRELQAVLNEELERLPEKYRAPFIMCCLEGKSGPQAARQLGWKVGTVTGRLTEARKLLQHRLARRGVLLSSVLITTAVSREGAAVASVALAPGTVKAALAWATQATTAGMVSAKVAGLVEAMAQKLFVTKLKVATAVLLAASALAGAGAMAHQALGARNTPPPAQKAETATKPKAKPQARRTQPTADANDKAGDTIEVSGCVLDPAGKPLSGAKIYMTRSWRYVERPASSPVYATTGEDGRFAFTVPRVPFANEMLELVATAKDFGATWVQVGLGIKKEKETVTLRLVKDDVPLAGQIVDLQGKPVQGATIRVLRIDAAPKEDLGPWLEAAKNKKGQSDQLEKQYLTQRLICSEIPVLSPNVTTERDGRFQLTGFGRNRLVTVRIEGPTIASQDLHILTRLGKAFAVAEAEAIPEYGQQGSETTYHPALFKHVAGPTKPIVGSVRDKDTQQPLAGVPIKSYKLANNPIHNVDFIETKTDAQGRYRLHGMPKGEDNKIRLVPRDDQPYLGVLADVPNTPGFDPVTVDFEVKRGVWIKGKVTDKATGKPLQGRVSYYALVGNPHLPNYPGFAGVFANIPVQNVREDGAFRIVGLPGPGVLTVQSSDHYLLAQERDDEEGGEGYLDAVPYPALGISYNAFARIDPPKDAERVNRDITLDPGITFAGEVVGLDGKPLTGVHAYGLTGSGGVEQPPLEKASFTVHAFNPRRPRTTFFRHLEKRLAGVLEPPKDANKPFTVRLQPGATITGRLVDEDGRPRANVELFLNFRTPTRDYLSQYHPSKIKTDQAGRVHLEALLPGYDFELTDRKGGVRFGAPKSGQTKNLGDMQLKRRSEE